MYIAYIERCVSFSQLVLFEFCCFVCSLSLLLEKHHLVGAYAETQKQMHLNFIQFTAVQPMSLCRHLPIRNTNL